MAAKKPAVTTQLKTANARIAELEKQIKDGAWQVPHYKKQADEANAELENVHAIFDAMPGCIARKKDGEYSSQNIAAATRLASWLASRQ